MRYSICLPMGTSITPLPRRRPWKGASEAIAIDHLSRGRLILGVGLGDKTTDASLSHFGEAGCLTVPEQSYIIRAVAR